jgi:hypothetical protein
MKRVYMKFPPRLSVWHTMPDGTRILRGRRAGVRDNSTCYLEKKDFDELVEKIGKEAADKIKAEFTESEKRLAAAAAEANKGLMSKEDFEKFKTDELAKINEKLAAVDKMEAAVKEQGTKMNELLERGAPKSQTFEEFFQNTISGEKGEKLQELRAKNGYVEFTASQLKAAGITSIGGTTIEPLTSPPGSPYLPGIGGSELQVFDIRRNPNFILDKVDMGRTNQSRLAWINETGEEGLPAEVAEGGEKPLIQNKFQLETSVAKKIAAYFKITEEFEQDVPQLATLVRRMLQERIIRAWDDAIQLAVEAIATAYSAAPLNGSIPFANFWDAVYAMMAQVRVANFIPNSVNIHPYTNVKMQGDKSTEGIYLLPSFKDEIQRMLTQSNKMSVDNALVGDLTQYKVDVYKEFVLKVGWVNDDFIHNQFCVLGEIRYHRYISDNRKTAIVKGNLSNIRALLDGGSGS